MTYTVMIRLMLKQLAQSPAIAQLIQLYFSLETASKADSSGDLAKILTNLQEAINSDAALPEGKKKEALDAVQTIAEEAQKPPSDRILKLCSMAVNALTGITTAVTDASKLTEVLTTHLPTLTRLLGI